MLRAVATLSILLALGACAHGEAPMAPQATQATQDRWDRIMKQMRADSAEAAAHATSPDPTPSYQGDGSVPAGIDIAHFELPIQYNEQVQRYINLYAHTHRATFVAWLRRMGRYRDYIEQRLAASGLPRELIYLPLIESGYDATVTSSASAVGLWQFMSGTARAEGLEVSEYIDERRDPYRATDAAIRHLTGLHQEFGSWYLAAAAYNSGSGRIGRLLKEYGRTKGPDETFWEVQEALPQETKGYVPGLIAAAIIGEYPQLFGIDGDVRDPAVRFEIVSVPGATDLRAVALAAATTTDEIRGLNPQFIRGMTPPGRASEVRIPIGAGKTFTAAFAKIPTETKVRDFGRTHVVKDGETLSEIAEHYGTTVEALQKANRIVRPSMVAVGRKLVIPVTGAHGAD